MTSSEEPAPGRAAPDAAGMHRLHPVTLVLRFVVSAPAMAFLLIPVFRQGGTEAWFNLVLTGIYAAVIVPWLVVNYLRFRYRVEPGQIVVESGVTTRTRRSIPVDRIQNVEIEQQLLQRLTGTARVRIYTAGSPQAEGSLEVVSLQEAERIRSAVRAFQKAARVPAEPSTLGEVAPGSIVTPSLQAAPEPTTAAGLPVEAAARPHAEPLFSMDLRRTLLSGVFRFSLLYVGLAFSLLQYWEPDPEAMVMWLMRGPLEGVAEAAADSPWATAIAALLAATAVGWLSGILVNLNRFYRFELSLDAGRLHRSHGLLSKSQATIPLRKVQALVVRTNPLMRHFGWYALDAQTMGIDAREQGHAAVVPFARFDELRAVAHRIRAGMPDPGESFAWPDVLEPVSRLTIRRAFLRYVLLIALAAGAVSWQIDERGWWFLLLVVPAAWLAVARWRAMGWAVEQDHLVVRRGVFRRHTWVIPLARAQVVYVTGSFFQRRLGLRTLYVDTAGANPAFSSDVIDLEAPTADRLAEWINLRAALLSA